MQGKDFKEKECMSFDGFCACIRLDIQKKLGSGVVVKEEVITKNNNTKKKALTIRKQGDNVFPTIYTECLYEEYKGGASLQDIEDSILQAYQEDRAEEFFDATAFKEWRKVKERIVYKFVNFGRNRELLKDVPHRRILDLAIVCEYLPQIDNEGWASILVRNGHIEGWGITEEELHAVAFRNTLDLLGYSITSLKNFMLEIMGRREAGNNGIEDLPGREELEKDLLPVYMLTNQYGLHGFGTVLYTDRLQAVADKWDCDIYILPSSVHEAILVPADRVRGCKELSQIVRDTNRTRVKPEEFLSDNVYKFVRETGKIVMQEEKTWQ